MPLLDLTQVPKQRNLKMVTTEWMHEPMSVGITCWIRWSELPTKVRCPKQDFFAKQVFHWHWSCFLYQWHSLDGCRSWKLPAMHWIIVRAGKTRWSKWDPLRSTIWKPFEIKSAIIKYRKKGVPVSWRVSVLRVSRRIVKYLILKQKFDEKRKT